VLRSTVTVWAALLLSTASTSPPLREQPAAGCARHSARPQACAGCKATLQVAGLHYKFN
jgi:hypothetical protein